MFDWFMQGNSPMLFEQSGRHLIMLLHDVTFNQAAHMVFMYDV